MEEKTIHLLKIRLRVGAKLYGSIAVIFALFFGVFYLNTFRADADAMQEQSQMLREDTSEKTSEQMRLPPQFLQGNPPLSAMKNHEQAE